MNYDETDFGIEYPFEETGGSGDENRIRGNWSLKLDYLFSVFGYTFALGNLWRFPYQCGINGGIAYLIPYTILFFVGALPILFMELSLGQFVSLGPASVWRLAPLFKGCHYFSVFLDLVFCIGISMLFVSTLLAIYYNLITAWAFYYMINSLKFSLPWTTCGNEWNSENCSVWNKGTINACRHLNGSFLSNGTCVDFNNIDPSNNNSVLILDSNNKVMAGIEYFHNQVLMISSGILDFETINWQLAICLLVAWLFVFLCSFKGIKTSGKAVYVTVLFPYIILIVLIIRFFTLPGSLNGFLHFMKPDMEIIRDLRVWGNAAIQVFYSLSTCTGGLITLSSYNKFHNNVFADIWLISLFDFLASILMSSLFFAAVGFVCHERDIELNKFQLQEGLQMIFVFFSDSLSKMPVAQIYSLFFFTMVALVIFNTELFIVETIVRNSKFILNFYSSKVSSICDLFPERLRRSHRHVLTFTIFTFFVLGIPLCSAAGIYWIILFEHFGVTWPLIIIGFFEVMTVCWIYGVDNFLDNVKWMIGFYPPLYLIWKILWKFICPFLLLLLLSLIWINNYSIEYNFFVFPQWSIIFGWTISLSPVFIIFTTIFFHFIKSSGSFSQRIRELLCPADDWGPALAIHRAELYPLQIPEARNLMIPPSSRIYKNVGNNGSMEQFIDRYNRPFGTGIYPQQDFDKIISKQSFPEEKETII
uniref:Transporter n=1 Tax=Meloidogyne hapla TaxID=6305 RepID=A0A1I8BTP1_MELHA